MKDLSSTFRWWCGGGGARQTHQGQGAVAAHAVAEDANAVRVQLLEVLEDGPGEFRGDVAVHFVTLAPGGFGRVDVEARAAAEVVRVVFALDFQTACD